MYYMITGRPRDGERSSEDANSSRLAPLNPAHLTHEPVRRTWSWVRFAVAVAVGALIVEAFRFGFLHGL